MGESRRLKRKAEDEDEESRLKKIIKRISNEAGANAEIAEVEVNEEDGKEQVKCKLKQESRSWILFKCNWGEGKSLST